MVDGMKVVCILQCTRRHMKQSQLIGNLLSLNGFEMMSVVLRDFSLGLFKEVTMRDRNFKRG